MAEAKDPKEQAGAAKTRRSRNGCTECRRLHRRCDEGKPECQNCIDAEKTCFYQKQLSWGGRPFKRGPFQSVLKSGIGQISTSSDDSTDRSFVYGQIDFAPKTTSTSSSRRPSIKLEKRPRSVPAVPSVEQSEVSSTSLPGGVAFTSVWIPWLSEHHRMLFHHFAGTTLAIFDDSPAVQQEIRSTVVPMAIDTNHGFSLLASILSLASTHRRNLGLHTDSAEIEYWRDMAMGHLRRPGVHEDGSTENGFAATALMLCIRDIISDVERSFSWKLHLQGAFTVLNQEDRHLPQPAQSVRRILTKLASSLQLRSLLPAPFSSQTGPNLARQYESSRELKGLPSGLVTVLRDIRSLRQERSALRNIELHSNSSNMDPLWSSLKGRCLENIVAIRTTTDELSLKEGGPPILFNLYAYTALIQIYWGVLELPPSDSGLSSTLDVALSLLRSIRLETSAEISTVLIHPLFTIGCLATSIDDRHLIGWALSRIGREHGKANAILAKGLLEELWNEASQESRPVTQGDVDGLTTEKGWDLSLW